MYLRRNLNKILIIIFFIMVSIFFAHRFVFQDSQTTLRFLPDKTNISCVQIVPVHNEKYAFSYTDKEKVSDFMSRLEMLKLRNDTDQDEIWGLGMLIRFFDKDGKKVEEWVWSNYVVVNSTGQRLKVLENGDHLIDDFILSNTPDILEEIPYKKHG